MSNNDRDRKLIAHLNGDRDPFDEEHEMDALSEPAFPSQDDGKPVTSPTGLARRTIAALRSDGFLPRSIWIRPITNIGARISAAAVVLLAVGLLFQPNFAERVESIQKKVLGKKVTNTLSSWGDKILDTMS